MSVPVNHVCLRFGIFDSVAIVGLNNDTRSVKLANKGTRSGLSL